MTGKNKNQTLGLLFLRIMNFFQIFALFLFIFFTGLCFIIQLTLTLQLFYTTNWKLDIDGIPTKDRKNVLMTQEKKEFLVFETMKLVYPRGNKCTSVNMHLSALIDIFVWTQYFFKVNIKNTCPNSIHYSHTFKAQETKKWFELCKFCLTSSWC